MTDQPEYVRRNRDHGDQLATYVAAGERAWANNAPSWGIWSVPESDTKVFTAARPALSPTCSSAVTGFSILRMRPRRTTRSKAEGYSSSADR